MVVSPDDLLFPARALADDSTSDSASAIVVNSTRSVSSPNVQVLFADDMSNGLAQWTGKYGGEHQGIVVPDPLGTGRGDVLTFTGLNAAGDIFTVESFASSGSITLSFDYLGLPMEGSVPNDLGGFFGIDESPPNAGVWLAGTSPIYSDAFALVDDGQWHTIVLTLKGQTNPFHLMMEDWVTSDGVAGDVYFDNIRVEVADTAGSISGTVYKDVDQDGRRDPGEVGLKGRRVYIDLDNDRKRDGNEPSAVTDGSGRYTLSHLAAGYYNVRQVLPRDWAQSTPAKGYGFKVNLKAGQAYRGVLHGSYWAVSSISGRVFNDRDRDGRFDSNESPLQGRQVFADFDNDKKLDANEPSAVTDSRGWYKIRNLVAGDYNIRQVLPKNWAQSTPANGYGLKIHLKAGQAYTGALHGSYWTLGSISGRVFSDRDRDGRFDSGESPIPGRRVYLDLDNDRRKDADEPLAVTDGNGWYRLRNLRAGDYNVRQVLPAGWEQTTPRNGYGVKVHLLPGQNRSGFLHGANLMTVDGSVLLVSGFDSDNVVRFDAASGTFIDELVAPGVGGLSRAEGISFAPDGSLLVNSFGSSQVLRHDGETGAFKGVFASIASPTGLVVRNGLAYVGSFSGEGLVNRYDATTGSFVDTFVKAGSGSLSLAHGLAFGPDGNLYVSDVGNDRVSRYDGTTGAFLGVFASGGGLDNPTGLAFGPDGDLYIASNLTNSVLRYDGTTGAFDGALVPAASGGLVDSHGLLFRSDGRVYVSGGAVRRYDATAGDFIDVFASSPLITRPTYFALGPASPSVP